ncbi:MAG: hypothetical protein HY954_06785 [Deltaproteobacteria bacterium]|nr:hypothetical protein [Deltaproteobacteria bacterium]
MFKINSVVGHNLTLSDKVSDKGSRPHHDDSRTNDSDSVVISEEGKKKHILGQLMARISDQGSGKKI